MSDRYKCVECNEKKGYYAFLPSALHGSTDKCVCVKCLSDGGAFPEVDYVNSYSKINNEIDELTKDIMKYAPDGWKPHLVGAYGSFASGYDEYKYANDVFDGSRRVPNECTDRCSGWCWHKQAKASILHRIKIAVVALEGVDPEELNEDESYRCFER